MSFPTFKIGDLTLPRLLLGGNPVSGFSHRSAEATEAMLDYFTADRVKDLLRQCEACGIDAAVMRADNHIIRLLREHWNEGGTLRWLAQTAPGEDHGANIDKAARYGACAIYIHGGVLDTLFHEGEHDRVPELLERIKSLGLPAGCASHVPANHLEMQRRGWDLDFHMVCLHNLSGYKGELGTEKEEEFSREDREIALDASARLERPCIAYKILGAGRYEPRAAFEETFARIKPIDGVAVGMFPPDCGEGDIVAQNAEYTAQFGSANM